MNRGWEREVEVRFRMQANGLLYRREFDHEKPFNGLLRFCAEIIDTSIWQRIRRPAATS